MTPIQLTSAIGCSSMNAMKWAAPLTEAMDKFEINTPARQAAFLAQVGHESNLLSAISENLNYSAAGLMAIFPRYFNEIDAERFARNQVKIANRVYANRMGNGDEASGDGWKFRGRGLIQVTGHDNYKACGDALGIDLLVAPDQLTGTSLASMSAAWYWKSHGLNQLADAGNFDTITARINGGQNGRAERRALWAKAKSVLGII
jgi:putative chitinase